MPNPTLICDGALHAQIFHTPGFLPPRTSACLCYRCGLMAVARTSGLVAVSSNLTLPSGMGGLLKLDPREMLGMVVASQ